MIYDVRQTTTYVYDSAVTRARHVLRLVPVARERLRITRRDARRRSRADAATRSDRFFPQPHAVIELEEPHDSSP